MKVSDYACDVCRKRRGQDANHWHLVFRGSPEIIIRPLADAPEADIDRADFHVCGLACLLQKVNQLCEAPARTLEG
jgi:hypothetical protein